MWDKKCIRQGASTGQMWDKKCNETGRQVLVGCGTRSAMRQGGKYWEDVGQEVHQTRGKYW